MYNNKNKIYYAIKPRRRIPKIHFLLFILMIIQFSRPVSAAKDGSDGNNRIKETESTPKHPEPIERHTLGSSSVPTTKEELTRRIVKHRDAIDNLQVKLMAEKNKRIKEKKEYEENAREKYMALEKQYADMKSKQNAAIADLEKTQTTVTDLEKMKKTITDLEKRNTILSWMVFILSIVLFLTICILYFKFKYRPWCAKQTVEEIIPEEMAANSSSRTSLQVIQDPEYWPSSTSFSSPTLLFGTDTLEIARHHFRPTTNSSSSSESTKPNNRRSNNHQFRQTYITQHHYDHFRPTHYSSSASPKPTTRQSNHQYRRTPLRNEL